MHHIEDKNELTDTIRKHRVRRNILVFLLLFALSATLLYGTLENPFLYSLSKIGNYFPYRKWYILWAILIGLVIQSATLCLFRLEQYPPRYAYVSIYCATFFLIVTALIPSLKEEMYVLHLIHKWTTFFYVMSTLTALHPFILYLGRTKPRLWVLLRNWELLILVGSMSSLIIQGQTGIFELWFIVMTLSLLGYLVIILHGHKIEKLQNSR